MKRNLLALCCGVLFGIGLLVSGMTQPSKVLGFLDVTGAWDPSLMFVMIGGIGVHLVLSHWIVKRSAPLFDTTFHLPAHRRLDPKLVGGAALFGVGWGLGGFCPGPALTTALTSTTSLTFVVAMAVGMLAHALHSDARKARARPCAAKLGRGYLAQLESP